MAVIIKLNRSFSSLYHITFYLCYLLLYTYPLFMFTRIQHIVSFFVMIILLYLEQVIISCFLCNCIQKYQTMDKFIHSLLLQFTKLYELVLTVVNICV